MTWIAGTVLLVYLAGTGAVAYALGHYLPEFRDEDPALDLTLDTQPAGVALLLTLAVLAWPVTIPFAICDSLKNRNPS